MMIGGSYTKADIDPYTTGGAEIIVGRVRWLGYRVKA